MRLNQLFNAAICAIILVLTGGELNAQSFLITEPPVGVPLLVGQDVTIRWQGVGDESVTLTYSTDEGNTWLPLAQDITAGSYDWTIPDLQAPSIIFRAQAQPGELPAPLYTLEDAHPSNIRYARFSPEGSLTLTVGENGLIRLIETQETSSVPPQHPGFATPRLPDVDPLPTIFQAEFYRTRDSVLITFGTDVLLWTPLFSADPLPLGLNGHTDQIRAVAVHPERPIFATGSTDSTLRVWDLKTGAEIDAFTTGLPGIYDVEFSDDGSILACAGNDGFIYTFDWENDDTPIVNGIHGNPNGNKLIWSLAFAPDNSFIASGGIDNTVKRWDPSTGSNAGDTLGIFGFHVRDVSYSRSGERILAGSLDSTFSQWNAQTGAQIGLAVNAGAQLLSVAYSPSGDSIITVGRDQNIRVWSSNFREPAEDTERYDLQVPSVIEIGDVVGVVGRSIETPVIWRRTSREQTEETLELALRVTIPSTLLQIDTSGEAIRSKRFTRTTDTAFVMLRVEPDSGDTIGVIPGLVLLGNPTTQPITLDTVEFINSNRYVVSTGDGQISVVDTCGVLHQRAVAFSAENPGIITLAPNPARDNVSVRLNLPDDNPVALEIISMRGEVVATLYRGSPGHGEYAVDVKKLPSGGEYVVRLTTAARVYSQKLIIMR